MLAKPIVVNKETDFVGKTEFSLLWRHWVKSILQPKNALVIINMQNDFLTGSCAMKNYSETGQDAQMLVPAINRLLDHNNFDIVIYVRECHPQNHITFLENVEQNCHLFTGVKSGGVKSDGAKLPDDYKIGEKVQSENGVVTLWPRHCVQDSWGGRLCDQMHIAEKAIQVLTGTHENGDSNSAFWDSQGTHESSLLDCLRLSRTTDVYLCGLTADECVYETALNATRHGFRTVCVRDAVCAMNHTRAIECEQKMKHQGVVSVCSDQVSGMLCAKDRRPDLGFVSAVNFAQAIKKHNLSKRIASTAIQENNSNS